MFKVGDTIKDTYGNLAIIVDSVDDKIITESVNYGIAVTWDCDTFARYIHERLLTVVINAQCTHTWIDTGMRRTYCKHCDARAELDVMNNTIRLIG